MKNFFTVLVIIIVLALLAWFFIPHTSIAPVPAAPVQTTPTVPVVTTPPPPTTTTYESKKGFSVGIPSDFTIHEDYDYQALEYPKDIYGVSFTIPARFATGTNLSDSSYISVETMPTKTAKSCIATAFLSDAIGPAKTLAEGTMTYSVATGGDAGAGNLYDETVYAFPANAKTCYGIRYFIHSMQIGNFPEGTVTAFDRTALLATFDEIRRSFMVTTSQ